MASFSNIFVLFLPKILLSVSCCNVLYVSILLSRLLVRSKSVQKCSTAQSFTFPKFTSFKLGTLVCSFFHNFCDFYLPTDNSRTEELPSSPPILTVIFKSLNLNLDIFLLNDFLILIFRKKGGSP